ncbi:MAG: NAD(P) transhydrogenase subunit alpha [Pirellulales bacterium]
MPTRRFRWAQAAIAVAVSAWVTLGAVLWAHPGHVAPDGLAGDGQASALTAKADDGGRQLSRGTVLVFSLTVFVLAVFVGFEVINKVPPTLHTPLMSGSNAISGITVVGAILAAGSRQWGFATWLGVIAAILANINVVGGFLVTHRMLIMFKKR